MVEEDRKREKIRITDIFIFKEEMMSTKKLIPKFMIRWPG